MELVDELCWGDNFFIHVRVANGEDGGGDLYNETLFQFVCRKERYHAIVALVQKGADVILRLDEEGEDCLDANTVEATSGQESDTAQVGHWHVGLSSWLQNRAVQLVIP